MGIQENMASFSNCLFTNAIFDPEHIYSTIHICKALPVAATNSIITTYSRVFADLFGCNLQERKNRYYLLSRLLAVCNITLIVRVYRILKFGVRSPTSWMKSFLEGFSVRPPLYSAAPVLLHLRRGECLPDLLLQTWCLFPSEDLLDVIIFSVGAALAYHESARTSNIIMVTGSNYR